MAPIEIPDWTGTNPTDNEEPPVETTDPNAGVIPPVADYGEGPVPQPDPINPPPTNDGV